MNLKSFKLILALTLSIQVGCKVRGDFYPILNHVKGSNVNIQRLSSLNANKENRIQYLWIDTAISFFSLKVLFENQPSIKYLEIKNPDHINFDGLCLLLHENKNITHLYLENMDSLTSSVRYLRHLEWLSVNNSSIREIPNELCELVSLETLNLGYLYRHYQKGNEISALPADFKKLNNLRYLFLSDNAFDEFPIVLCDMKGLLYVDFSSNHISKLPECICNNKKIKVKIHSGVKTTCSCPKIVID